MIFQLSSPKIPKNLPRPLSDVQIKKIIDRINKEKNTIVRIRNKAFVVLLWGSG
jgi:site-specific recombinase XerD